MFGVNFDHGFEKRSGSLFVKKMLLKWSTRTEWSMSTEPAGERSLFKTSQHRKRDLAFFEMNRSRFLDAIRFVFFINVRYDSRNSWTSVCENRPVLSTMDADTMARSSSNRSTSCLEVTWNIELSANFK